MSYTGVGSPISIRKTSAVVLILPLFLFFPFLLPVINSPTIPSKGCPFFLLLPFLPFPVFPKYCTSLSGSPYPFINSLTNSLIRAVSSFYFFSSFPFLLSLCTYSSSLSCSPYQFITVSPRADLRNINS